MSSSSYSHKGIGEYFQRHKVSRHVKADAVRLYMEGLSLSTAIGRRFDVSKEAVQRQWISKFEAHFASRRLSRRKKKKKKGQVCDPFFLMRRRSSGTTGSSRTSRSV